MEKDYWENKIIYENKFVVAYEYKNDNSFYLYALKKEFEKNAKVIELFKKQNRFLSSKNSPYFQSSIEVEKDDFFYYSLLEKSIGVDIATNINNNFDVALDLILKMLDIIQEVYDSNIIHGELTLNSFILDKGVLKIIDFTPNPISKEEDISNFFNSIITLITTFDYKEDEIKVLELIIAEEPDNIESIRELLERISISISNKKECYFCNKNISAELVKCPFCQMDLNIICKNCGNTNSIYKKECDCGKTLPSLKIHKDRYKLLKVLREKDIDTAIEIIQDINDNPEFGDILNNTITKKILQKKMLMNTQKDIDIINSSIEENNFSKAYNIIDKLRTNPYVSDIIKNLTEELKIYKEKQGY